MMNALHRVPVKPDGTRRTESIIGVLGGKSVSDRHVARSSKGSAAYLNSGTGCTPKCVARWSRTKSHSPLMIKSACLSFGVHCRFTMTSLASFGHRCLYPLSTFSEVPNVMIRSAFPTWLSAFSQRYGSLKWFNSPKWTIESYSSDWHIGHIRPVLCLRRFVFSVTSNNLEIRVGYGMK